MLIQFNQFIKQNLQLPAGSKVLLAVSGGVDSMVMLDLFNKSSFEFAVAHCNFNLRGDESKGDAAFVKAYAKKLNLKFHSIKFNTKIFSSQHKISTQMAARQLRYNWFDELLKKFDYDFIAVAHHQTDVLETMLINQIRGTGLSGLHGILPHQNKIIRPLLFATRDEILSYAKQHKLNWREDSSNSHDDYMRNKIRLKILPLLKGINPSIEKTFAENAQRFYDAELLIEAVLPQLREKLLVQKQNTFIVSIPKLLKQQQPKSILYFLLRDFNFKNNLTDEIFESLNAESGKKFFSESHQLVKDRNSLIIETIQDSKLKNVNLYLEAKGLETKKFRISIEQIDVSKIKKTVFNASPTVAYFDADKIVFPLRIRSWQRGDYFYPFGMKGRKKKLSDYFTDEKISLIDKEHIPILLNGNDICWVIGKRSDERFKVSSATKTILKLTYEQF